MAHLCQIRNDLRSLLSLTGGRLPAEQAVSKPDAKAERGQHLHITSVIFCQDLVAKATQNCCPNVVNLRGRNEPGDVFSLATRADPAILESVQSRTRYRRRHVTLRPHVGSRKRMGQWLGKLDQYVERHRRRRCGCAQRNNCNNVIPSREPWHDDHDRSSLHHFRNDKTVEIAKKYFAQSGIVCQRHVTSLIHDNRNSEGL